MWSHLGHFIGTILGVFFNAIGSTLLGKIADTAFFILVMLLSFRHAHKRGGWIAVKQFWDDEAKFTLKTSMIVAACIYVPVFVGSFVFAIYQDHAGLVARSRVQRAELQHNATLLQNQKTDDAQLLTRCENGSARIEGKNETLSDQNRDQQNTINNCQTEALKLLEPKTLSVQTYLIDPIPEQPPTGVVKSRVLLLVNKPVSPVTIQVACEAQLDDIGLFPLTHTNAGVLQMSSQRKGPNEFVANVSSPAITPEAPFIAVLTHTGLMGNCRFNLQ